MPTLLVSSLDPQNAVSFYRTYGPLSRLPDWRLVPHTVSSWDALATVDAVWIERPTDQHVELVKLANAMRIPVVVDIDDNLLAVPPYNPHYALYSLPAMKEGIGFCVKNADAVVVSTRTLAEEVELMGAKPIVIPNAYDADLFAYAETMRADVNPVVVWRGTHTHSGDVLPVADQIEQLMQRHPEWQFVFMGDCPFVSMDSRNARHIGPLPMTEYFRVLYDMNPAFVIVPLADNIFNRCKSNSAWLEATHAQAVCISRNWSQWSYPGVQQMRGTLFGEVDAAIVALDERDGVLQHRRQVAESRRYIKDNLLLADVNEKRLDVLEGLL